MALVNIKLQFFGGRGASSSGGNSSRGVSQKINNFESEIYQSDSERSLIITADGKELTFGGDENHVFADKETLNQMEGATATHNHPNDAIFSQTDIENGIAKGNLKEMRIVTKSGEVHSLINNSATQDQRRAFLADYNNKMMKANNNIHAKERRGERVNRNEYVKNFMSNWMSENASNYGLEYKKGRVK